MAWLDPAEWSFGHRAAVTWELGQPLLEVIARMARLSREFLAEASVADYLVSRRKRLRLDREELSV